MPEVDTKTYQSALSGLMYAMLAMHPDLAYAVGALSKHTACPGQAHFAALKQVYHYLRGMMDTHLIYRKTTDMSLFGYVDADWAGDMDDCHSISGYTSITARGAISWSSKKQPSITSVPKSSLGLFKRLETRLDHNHFGPDHSCQS